MTLHIVLKMPFEKAAFPCPACPRSGTPGAEPHYCQFVYEHEALESS